MPISEKSDSELNIALNLNNNDLEKSTLKTGYNFSENIWEVIVKYNGNLEIIKNELNVEFELLSSNYAIITLSKDKIPALINYRQIEYIEKPKLLLLMLNNSLRTSCISQITKREKNPLTGKGVIIGIIDSGINYTHPDFRNPNGTTRILYLWDQTDSSGIPPNGFLGGSQYTEEQINNALNSINTFEKVPHIDSIGHGTAVAGVAAGNGRRSNGTYSGVAPESSLIIVKLGERGRESFAKNTEIMRAIKYILDKSIELNMPVVINLSFGTNNGSHSGTSLFETFIDDMANIWKCSICVASGNEGSSGHHYSNKIGKNETQEIEFIVSGGLRSLFISLWKNFVDKFNFELISPNGNSTGIVRYNSTVVRYDLNNSSIFTNIGLPTPYNADQQVFFEIIANEQFIPNGLWKLKIYGDDVVFGKYNIWLPITEEVTAETRFITPTIYTTLTLPSTAKNVITVGGYNSQTNAISPFSGRGYTRLFETVKPDLVAPAYEITTTNTSGGYSPQTGTSIAAPHVSGACAILMQWGIVNGNDPFMYGQKIKAYLRLGARRNLNLEYPNRDWGYGSLCLENTFNNLITPPLITTAQNTSSTTPIEEIINSNDYADYIVQLTAVSRNYIENDPNIEYCKFLDDDYAVIYINRKNLTQYNSNPLSGFIKEPFLLGLMDTTAIESAGILDLQTQPYLNLTGQNILIAIIDTGIDYTNEAFIYEDGTSKIYSIWDQTIQGTNSNSVCYGTEYTNSQINDALANENPLDIVPTTDDVGHGTFLASISSGRTVQSQNFVGAAPDSTLVVVKLKQAKEYLKQSKAMFTSANAYSSSDLMFAIDYVKSVAEKLQKPIAICISLGTNEGSHNGLSILESYISSIALKEGYVICEAAGNEASAKHHTLVTLSESVPSKDVEFIVDSNEKGFTLNIWAYLPDRISISLTSPLGGIIERIQPILNSRREINLPLENTTVIIEYPSSQLVGIGQQIKITFLTPSEGNWKLTLYGDLIINGIINLWLPISGFIEKNTAFLTPDPAYTTVVPATGRNIISVGGYDHTTNGIYVNSSRGPNTLNLLKPLFVAPAVNVFGASNLNGFTRMSGTSVSAAITTGAAALLLEWGYVRGNDYFITTPNAASYFIRGTVRVQDELYPNNIWGYGTLNLYNSFRVLL